jgi:hypothetical protein
MFRETQKSSIVGRILKIIPQGGCSQNPTWPMIQVQWYYKKMDLDTKKLAITDEELEFIGDNEVFPSRHKDIVFADAIVSKCDVYPIKQYDELESINYGSTYFTRASYCPLARKLSPCFADWERLCTCKQPLNPNRVHIRCDKCDKWFHPKC